MRSRALDVAAADVAGQFLLVASRKERGFVDLAQVGLERRLHGGGSFASCLSSRSHIAARVEAKSRNFTRQLSSVPVAFLQRLASGQGGRMCTPVRIADAKRTDPAGNFRRGGRCVWNVAIGDCRPKQHRAGRWLNGFFRGCGRQGLDSSRGPFSRPTDVDSASDFVWTDLLGRRGLINGPESPPIHP